VAVIASTVIYYVAFQGDALMPTNFMEVLASDAEPEFESSLVLTGWHFAGMVGHALLHADILHLLGNMLFLWVFGNAICAKIGNLPYLLIYALLAGYAGATHLVFAGGPMIGASGAINGIVGVFLMWYPLNSISCIYWFYIRGGTFQIASYWMILFWLMFDIWGVASSGDSVAYWAHLGGFLAGLSLGAVLLLTRAVKMVDLERSLIDAIRNKR
ncbi:MAG: rhomboid family intramembrane serine protease, partial [Planctomycetes bacterium]|nr:rhomboid family intramembrane serine protease [Planctomycetota bacterium]